MTIPIGAEQELNFGLRLGPGDQRVEVEGPGAGIGRATSALGAMVIQGIIEELPLNGRSWTDLAVLEPGVAPIEAQASYTVGNGRGNRGFGAQMAISGGRPQQTNYRLDDSNFLPPLNKLKSFDVAGRPVASAGLLDTTATPSRQIQFALKLVW